MFHLIRFAIWIVGAVVVWNFLLNFFHYEIDWKYAKESQNRCFVVAADCQKNIAKEGVEKARCKIACFEFSKLVKKK